MLTIHSNKIRTSSLEFHNIKNIIPDCAKHSKQNKNKTGTWSTARYAQEQTASSHLSLTAGSRISFFFQLCSLQSRSSRIVICNRNNLSEIFKKELLSNYYIPTKMVLEAMLDFKKIVYSKEPVDRRCGDADAHCDKKNTTLRSC